MDYRTTIQAGSVMCEETLKSWEPLCCPPPNPCVICPNGVSVNDNYTPFVLLGYTCGEIMSAASSFEAGSDWCIITYDACCLTQVTPAPNPLPTVDVSSFMPTASPSETPTLAPTTSSFFSPMLLLCPSLASFARRAVIMEVTITAVDIHCLAMHQLMKTT